MASDSRKFLAQVAQYREDMPQSEVEGNASLAVGFLLGAGFPACAAIVAVLMEKQFPELEWEFD